MEKKMNGKVRSASDNMINPSCSRSLKPRLMPMNKASCLSALSLKAPWNWVTMSAQNPRREEVVVSGVPP